MDLGLSERVVVVTGASKGIGFACANAFARERGRVALVSRSRANLDLAIARITGAQQPPLGFVADLADAAQAARMIDDVESRLGPIDVLVNSAGAAKRYPPEALDAAAWHDTMDAKYFTTIHVVDPAIKRMAARGRGVIVNIIGQGGKVAGDHHIAGGAANAALMLVSAGMAAAYAGKGVRVNAVNPGLTLTERLQEGMKADAKLQGIGSDEALQRAKARLPLGRIAAPEEIANAVVFLASPKASYITGAIVAMDGAVTPMI